MDWDRVCLNLVNLALRVISSAAKRSRGLSSGSDQTCYFSERITYKSLEGLVQNRCNLLASLVRNQANSDEVSESFP